MIQCIAHVIMNFHLLFIFIFIFFVAFELCGIERAFKVTSQERGGIGDTIQYAVKRNLVLYWSASFLLCVNMFTFF